MTTRAGKTSTKTLGDLVEQVSPTEALYVPAKESQEDLPAVPNGHYAVEINDAILIVKVVEFRNGTVHVFDADDSSVEHPTKQVLEAIVEAGIGDSAKLYGQLRGRCYRCDSPLENRLSVELAMGPVCAKYVWPHAAAADEGRCPRGDSRPGRRPERDGEVVLRGRGRSGPIGTRR